MKTYTETEGVLYHYCSIEALCGILTSRTLRLTNIRFMNDSKEISWLYELAKKALRVEASAQRAENEIKLCKALLDHCDNLFLDDTFFPHFYCSCFSKDGDSLSQWRAYASDAKGVAIGFSRQYLESFDSMGAALLSDVEYRIESDIADLTDDFNEAIKRLRESKYPFHDDQITSIALKTEMQWDLRAPFCKNPAFSEEKEVRLVHIAGPTGGSRPESKIGPLEFFQRGDVIVPYKALPLNPSEMPISKIVLGPRNRLEHNRSSIYSLAQEKGFCLALDQFEVSPASYGEIRRMT
jgi:hypothetical protein